MQNGVNAANFIKINFETVALSNTLYLIRHLNLTFIATSDE